MLDLWYKSAIIYCIDVENFIDGNGDGVGDFEGLTERLDYLSGLGITCIWLMPFYPTPNLDNGYDVKDYYNVDPRHGTLGDFVEFMRQASDRGLRVIIDLVVNHTSIEHPWFQQARQDKHSKYHDFYVWSEEKPPDAEEGIVFPGVQTTTWTYDNQAQEYYFHRFYEYQADLNISNPAVREEIYKIMGFWLQLGVSGFRIDAAPFLVELKGIKHPDVSDPYLYLKEIRNLLSWRVGDGILLAEANVSKEQIPNYFGDGDKMHLLFDFILNQHIFLALAREKAEPIVRALNAPLRIPARAQWANFIRNHDELTLDKLSEAARDEIAAKFAQDKDMWVYNRGIRRRLPPMLDGDERRIRLAYSLMLTLPGTPVIGYGEEIGMGDDLSLPERNSTRTPMQWSREKNAGFSIAAPESLVRPVICSGPYGYEQGVNVIDERRNPNSMLNWMERAIRTRRACSEFGWGKWSLIETGGHESIFAHRSEWQGRVVLAVHNLSNQACEVKLELQGAETEHLVELFGDQPYEEFDRSSFNLQLEGYGYRWFRIGMRHLF